MAHFHIQNLTFSYPGSSKKALDDVSLCIEKGAYFVICGQSGSGKTTLLRHLKTVLAPHGARSGSILFNEKPLENVAQKEQSASIGFVMQNPDDQIVTDKVWHELAFGLESLGCDEKIMRLRVAEMASYFGIQDWFHRDVAELSGGQKQLLNLASIMAMHPEVLILDEPTSQLDPIAASDFLNTIKKINQELGTTVIITEHRLEEIYPVADRIVVMENGRIVVNDTPRKAGTVLHTLNSGMFGALPTPVRIFHKVGGVGECPLTVREGRKWLNERFHKHTVKNDSLNRTVKTNQNQQPALCIKQAWFRYEKDAPDVLKGLDLSVPEGSLSVLVGGNGTGKSTTLKAICGICKPYQGSIEIFGKKLKKYRSSELFHNCLSMLPQDPKSLFSKDTIKDELLEMCTDNAEILDISALCEITSLLDAHPYDLSGGEQQRCALAKVLLTRPKLLLLDEPTKSLDHSFKQSFADILCKLKASGVTILMVSHDIEFCAEHADFVSMFFDGQILTTDTPQRFFSFNSFYTTAANRMSRSIFKNAVTADDVAELCRLNTGGSA